jgi:hypothetical protein
VIPSVLEETKAVIPPMLGKHHPGTIKKKRWGFPVHKVAPNGYKVERVQRYEHGEHHCGD